MPHTVDDPEHLYARFEQLLCVEYDVGVTVLLSRDTRAAGVAIAGAGAGADPVVAALKTKRMAFPEHTRREVFLGTRFVVQ